MKRQNFSSRRLAIYNAVCSADVHPGARWVYENLKESYPNLSLGTVYRNIALFKEQGLITSVANVNGEERFDGNTTPHAHFICNKCGCIYDIFDDKLTALYKSISDLGFTIEHRSANFYGKCDKCS